MGSNANFGTEGTAALVSSLVDAEQSHEFLTYDLWADAGGHPELEFCIMMAYIVE